MQGGSMMPQSLRLKFALLVVGRRESLSRSNSGKRASKPAWWKAAGAARIERPEISTGAKISAFLIVLPTVVVPAFSVAAAIAGGGGAGRWTSTILHTGIGYPIAAGRSRNPNCCPTTIEAARLS